MERVAAVEANAAACQRSPFVDPRPSPAKAVTIERPMKVREGTGEHVDVGWLGKRIAEFEA